MRLISALVIFTAACSGSTSSATSSPDGGAEGGLQAGGDGGTCHFPAGAQTDSDASSSGCFAGPPAQACQVSNGATVLADGGVTGGTESCHPLCGASQYEMTCRSANSIGAIPAPESSLGCTIIPLPTPSNALFYCCPCE